MPEIDAGGVRMTYRFDGPDGAPLLLLSNSLGTEFGMWDGQIATLTRHRRVLRYNTRGHGKSALPPGPYKIADLGGDVIALLDGLGLARVDYCGLSMGGMIGMWLAINAPGRLGRLALCNTSAGIGATELWNQRIAKVEAEGMAGIAPAVLERWFTAGFRKREPAVVERIRTMLLATPADGYVACSAAVRDHDVREQLATIKAPTLVVAGRHDAATPPEQGRLIADRVPGARYVELEAAHLSNIEAADAYNAALSGFIGK